MSVQTFDTRIGREFAKLVKERQESIVQAVMNGRQNEQEYARETGRFRGLDEALAVYEEAEANVKAAERS